MTQIIIQESPVQVTVTESQPGELLVTVPEVRQIEVGVPGLQGPPGTGPTKIFTAGQVLGAHKIVARGDAVGRVFLADNTDGSIIHNVAGMTTMSAVEDGDVEVMTYGPVSDTGFALDPTKGIWLGADGVIVQDPPMTGYLLPLGYVIDSHTLFIRPGAAVFMGA